ncbi:MAG: serine--tRNA ligase [Candidatus Latescibacteria bacterium]|nr:serine--tRNA ligase [Candidatus Latescibacterota bacterium]
MLDIRRIKEHPEEVERQLKTRDPSITLKGVVVADERRRRVLGEVETLRSRQNEASKQIGTMRQRGEDPAELMREMQEASRWLRDREAELREAEGALDAEMAMLPNIPHHSVPVSLNPNEKVVVRERGTKRAFDFAFKNHVQLGADLGILDFERGAKIAGSQFPMYVGMGARLEWALINFMLDVHVHEHGYTPVIPPYLVNTATMFTSGNLPKFADQLYTCQDDDLYVIPTSEVPMTSIYRDEILNEEILPLYFTAYTACFRREAGTYGAKERGLVRVHQFNKVEMYKFTTEGASYDELEQLVTDAEDIVRRLGLHYRTVLLVTGDIGQQAAKTYDIEVYLPGQEEYKEVSSCSNCEDYQARRGNIRYRPKGGGRPKFVHTLNGSGVATSRLMISLLENYQEPDGGVVIPDVLVPYMHGIRQIGKKSSDEFHVSRWGVEG